MSMSFTKQDLDVMIEAVEKWENGNPMDGFADAMMMGMVGDKIPPEKRAEIEAESKERTRKREEATKLRKERGVLLRAKLIQMKQSMAVTEFCESAGGK